MENPMTKRMWRAFDNLYHFESEAKIAIEGWEHKEKVKEYHIVGMPSVIAQNIVDCKEVSLFTKIEDALDELYEWKSIIE